jgi:hypothetical protein
MTDDQKKKPGLAFWATVVVVVGLVAYPLSFGPACWITSRTNVGASAIPVLYRPLTWAMSPVDNTTINRVSRWYAKIGAPDDWEWIPALDFDSSGEPVGWWWGSTGWIVPFTPPPAAPSR